LDRIELEYARLAGSGRHEVRGQGLDRCEVYPVPADIGEAEHPLEFAVTASVRGSGAIDEIDLLGRCR